MVGHEEQQRLPFILSHHLSKGNRQKMKEDFKPQIPAPSFQGDTENNEAELLIGEELCL